MYEKFTEWLDAVLEENLPFENARGLCFNLYEEDDNEWSVQLIASESFDMEDDDWACDEVFTTGENLFIWKENASWEDIQSEASGWVMEYINYGEYAEALHAFDGLGVGFVDGDITYFVHEEGAIYE